MLSVEILVRRYLVLSADQVQDVSPLRVLVSAFPRTVCLGFSLRRSSIIHVPVEGQVLLAVHLAQVLVEQQVLTEQQVLAEQQLQHCVVEDSVRRCGTSLSNVRPYAGAVLAMFFPLLSTGTQYSTSAGRCCSPGTAPRVPGPAGWALRGCT